MISEAAATYEPILRLTAFVAVFALMALWEVAVSETRTIIDTDWD